MATINGFDGVNDDLDGGNDADTLNGLGGNDTLNGGEGNDTLKGGEGDDTLEVTAGGAETADGGAGTDRLVLDARTFGGGVSLPAPTQGASGLSGSASWNGTSVSYSGIEDITVISSQGSVADHVTTGAGDDVFHHFGLDSAFYLLDYVDLSGGNNDLLTADFTAVSSFAVGKVQVSDTRFVLTVGGNGKVDAYNVERLHLIGGSQGDDITGLVGADNLDGGGGNDTLRGGDGNDTIVASSGSDHVFGDAGIDTLLFDWSDTSSDVLPFSPAGFDGSFYENGGLNRQVNYSGIERFVITTGSGKDRITTGSGDDVVKTGAGNDVVNLGTGTGSADGGEGEDGISADLSAATDAIVWNLQTNSFSGGPNSFANFEYFGSAADGGGISTGSGNDVIATRDLNKDEVIRTGAGDDVITVVRGNDEVFGGDGNDTLVIDYSTATAQVTNFSPGGFDGAFYENVSGRQVSYSSVERFDIRSGSGNDNITVGSGNDTIDGGAGNDTLDGGTGRDKVSYASATGPVTVSLGVSDPQMTGAGVDTLINFEDLLGSSSSDTLIGSISANMLEGGAGDDTLTGSGGNDTIDGAAGTDTATFAGQRSDYAVSFVDGAYVVTDTRAGAPDGTDRLIAVESVRFADGTFAVADLLAPPTPALTAAPVNNVPGAQSGTQGQPLVFSQAKGNAITVSDADIGNGIGSVVLSATNGTLALGSQSNIEFTGNGTGTITVTGTLTAINAALNGLTYTPAANATGAQSLAIVSSDNGAGGTNLIVNGGAEQGTGAGDFGTSVLPSGWTAVSGNLSAVQYAIGGSGDLNSADSTAVGGGNDYFAGGPGGNSSIKQLIDVGGFASQIDSGLMVANLSGLFGGFGTQNDSMTLTVRFLAADGSELTQASIGGTLSADRDGQSRLVSDFGSGNVPAGTRKIEVVLNATRTEGSYNDGYADNLSLILSQSDADVVQINLAPANPGVTITGTGANDIISATKTVAGQSLPTINGDTLFGLGGNDQLDGAAGADTMEGGVGNDIYTVESAGDQVIETDASRAGGTDTIKSSISYTLGLNVEKLTLLGNAGINGTGNDGNNTLTGNGAGNRLEGLDGNDVLDGKAGADTMVGGIGNDTYVVDDAGDIIVETGTDKLDQVKASISFAIGIGIENLTLTGKANINGTGNGVANKLTGNTGNNSLDGDGGNDIIVGGVGNDTLIGGDGLDQLTGGAGGDSLTGGTGADKFIFVNPTESSLALPDVITDFNRSEGDKIDLAKIDANGAAAGNGAFTFIGTDPFTAAGQLRYEQIGSETFIYGNTDADGDAEFVIKFDDPVPLQATDFIL